MAQIIDPGILRPGTFLEVALGVGPRTGGGARKVLIFGNKLAAGSAAVATPLAVASEDDAATLFGRGSEIYRMARAAFAANPSVELSAIAITESGGAKATANIATITGTATGAGNLRIRIGDEVANVPITVSQTAAALLTAAEAAVDALVDSGVTGGVSASNLTATARQNGPRGNEIPYEVTYTGGAGLTITANRGRLTGGTTTDNATNALDAVVANRYEYLVAPTSQEATELAKFTAHVNTKALPENGLRSVVVAGSVTTIAATTADAIAENDPRLQIVWGEDLAHSGAEIAAAMAAYRAGRENADPAYNFDGDTLLGLVGLDSRVEEPTPTEVNSALNNGVTPLLYSNAGVTISRSITTRSQNAASQPDFAVLDTSKVAIPDAVADELAGGFFQEFSNLKAGPDVAAGDLPAAGVLTPSIVRDWIFGILKDFEDEGALVRVDELAPTLTVVLEDEPPGRFTAQIPIDCVEGAHQFAASVRQIG